MKWKTLLLALLLAATTPVLYGCASGFTDSRGSAAVVQEMPDSAVETESAVEDEETDAPEETLQDTAEPEAEPTENHEAEETVPSQEEIWQEPKIELTIPAEYADVRYRIGEITWNADDSVTYRLTEEEHEQLLAEVHADIQRELNEMCMSSCFLDFFSITANEDCSVFTVVCLAIETTRAEQESLPQLYEFGRKYAAYQGTEPGNIHIDYMNKMGITFFSRDSDRDQGRASGTPAE